MKNQNPRPRREDILAIFEELDRVVQSGEIASRFPSKNDHAAVDRVIDDLVFDGTVVALPGQRFKLAQAVKPSDLQAEKAPTSKRRTPSVGRSPEPAPNQRGPRRKGQEPSARSASKLETHETPAPDSDPRPTRPTVEGLFHANARGFGFVSDPVGGDIFVPPDAQGGALHSDRVRAMVTRTSSRGREGMITEVVSRGLVRISGALQKRGSSAWIEPDDTRFRGPVVLDSAKDGVQGDAVIVAITRYPLSHDENVEGTIEKVLGPQGSLTVEGQKILGIRGITEGFAPEVEEEARSFGAKVPESALVGREDLTHIPLPTIDPVDARDHDDAVWAIRNQDGSYRVWVAIADVSHYVREGTVLDKSALTRGNSIYLPDRAIPMLPRALSSNLCSLLPDEIRLCLAVEVDIDPTGTVTKSRLIEGFMKSAAKLTYENVARALGFSDTATQSAQAEAMKEDLAVLRDVSQLLRARRMRRGALQMEVPEVKISLDPVSKEPIDAERRRQDPGVGKAYDIIEDLMLLANETIAETLVEKDVPSIFRTHPPPDPVKIRRFAAMCERLGVQVELGEKLDPKTISAFMKKIRNHPSRPILDTLLVRSMKQASYFTENIGHFGLASKAYVHFTSPIRRYPDVTIHRAVRRLIRGEAIDRSEQGLEALRKAATAAAFCERNGMEVERDTSDLYRAFLMKKYVGQTFMGKVSGFGLGGVFVALDAPFVDVHVRAQALGSDDFELDEDGLSMIAARSGERIDLGDAMEVLIEDSLLDRRMVVAKRISSGARDDDDDQNRERRQRGKSRGEEGRQQQDRSRQGDRGHQTRRRGSFTPATDRWQRKGEALSRIAQVLRDRRFADQGTARREEGRHQAGHQEELRKEDG